MERILAARLGHILVGADTCCLKCLARQLLVLIRYQVAAEGELIDIGALASQIENPDLKAISQQWTISLVS